jgi:CheY-like chemotaxis protein
MKRLLLVDDDESNRLTLSVLLEEEDYSVTVAGSCAEARAMLVDTAPYDLVLLDHALGDGVGSDLVAPIRQTMPKAKIVALSGSSNASETTLLLADLALPKGLHFPDLVQRLRTLCP